MKNLSNAQKKSNLAGNYICSGYDNTDGPFSGSKMTITLDEERSDFEHGHITYQMQAYASDGSLNYVGSIIANGNAFAMSFKNVNPAQEIDHGVLIGTITHDRNEDGKYTTALHNFYYQPDYKQGGTGSAVCIKQ